MSATQVFVHHEQLDVVDSALTEASAGLGRMLVIEGHAGVGKTTLLAETARRAATHGFGVGLARARGHQRDLPGSSLGALLKRLDGRRISGELAHELSERIDGAEPLALLLDDAHLADRQSLALLADFASRIEKKPVLLGLAFSEHSLDAHGRALVSRLRAIENLEAVVLVGLNADGCRRLIVAALPNAAPEFYRECFELTDGNPLLLRELLSWVAKHRLDPVEGAGLRALEPVPPRAMREFVSRQLEHLSADARLVAAAISFSDSGRSLEDISGIVELDLSRCLAATDELLETRLVKPGKLSFAATAVALCVRAHVMGDPRLVPRLVELADLELSSGNPDHAETLIRRALSEEGGDPQTRSRLLVQLGHVDLLRANGSSSASLASGVAGLQHADDRAEGLMKLGLAQAAAGATREASVTFETAKDTAAAGNPVRVQAAVRAALSDLLVPERRAAATDRLEQLASTAIPAAVRAELTLGRAWQCLSRAAPHDEVRDCVHSALVADRDGSNLGSYFEATAAALLAFLDDFDEARRLCEAARPRARAAGSRLAERNLDLAEAVALCAAGRVLDAARLSSELFGTVAETTGFAGALAAGIHASALHERDDLRQAESVMRAALAANSVPELPRLLLLESKIRICAATDRLPEALVAVREADFLAESLGILNPVVTSWRPLAALCHVRAGDRDRAEDVAADLEQLADRFGTPRAISVALRTKAAVSDPTQAIGTLERALEVLKPSSAGLERAKALVAYGSALHADRRNTAARPVLRKGIDLAERLGANRVSRQGLATLIAAGGRPRRVRTTGVRALTAAERRVVEAAARGATNRQIAEQLVVTTKTVEWHLRKAFVKLDVSSRDQLARAIAGHHEQRSAEL